jgi:hypothetical protein
MPRSGAETLCSPSRDAGIGQKFADDQMDLTRKTTVSLLGPDGTPLEKPATLLTQEEADLLRVYQLWGAKERLQATLTCAQCHSQMEVYVDGDIGMFCDCRTLLYQQPVH